MVKSIKEFFSSNEIKNEASSHLIELYRDYLEELQGLEGLSIDEVEALLSKARLDLQGISTIYDDEYQYSQYFKDSWACGLYDENKDEDVEVSLTLVLEVINMLDATGEDEYKDYEYLFSIGILNKDIHHSIESEVDCYPDEKPVCSDIASYYGLNMYLDEAFQSLDESNKKHYLSLSIKDACLYQYTCRFTKKKKNALKFKTYEAAKNFGELLISEYSSVIFGLIGFYLDRPVNLIGQTGWEQTEKLHFGK